MSALEIYKKSICDKVNALEAKANKYIQHRMNRMRDLVNRFKKVFKDKDRNEK